MIETRKETRTHPFWLVWNFKAWTILICRWRSWQAYSKTAGGDVGLLQKAGESTVLRPCRLRKIRIAQMVETDEITTVVANNRLTPGKMSI